MVMSPKKKRKTKTADEVEALEAVLALGQQLPKANSDEYRQRGEYRRLDELQIPRQTVLALKELKNKLKKMKEVERERDVNEITR